MSEAGQLGGLSAAEAVQHAYAKEAKLPDKSPLYIACERCLGTSFSEQTGLRLEEAKDKLAKLSEITTDLDKKSQIRALSTQLEQADKWQRHAWTEIQQLLHTVFFAKIGSVAHAQAVQASVSVVPPHGVTKTPVATQSNPDSGKNAKKKKEDRGWFSIIIARLMS